MIKVYCDRCGKEVGELEAYTILIQGPEIRSWSDEYLYDRKCYQVCKDCIKGIDEYIKAKQTDCPWK